MNLGRTSSQKLGWIVVAAGLFLGGLPVLSAQPAFKMNGKTVTVDDLYQQKQGKFYELEQKKYELIENLARQAYLEEFWEGLAEKQKTTPGKARQKYLEKHANVKDSEIADAMGKFKDHPRLKELSDKEKKKQISDYLSSVKTRDVVENVVQDAINAKKLVIMYPKPQEPLYNLELTSDDPVKYGPDPQDTKPSGCSGDNCPITVVEYSEFQCPFCERVLPTVQRLLKEYEGKVRWAVRDFPLGFHDRAKPAAVAAHCAKDQGKFWAMYEELFNNQRNLADKDLKSYAKNIGLDTEKFAECFSNPGPQLAKIEENYRSGEELGVTGTPAFFINGRRVSGALPYEEFKRIFEEELAKSKQKS
jgi:protein-disulfide isomerase